MEVVDFPTLVEQPMEVLRPSTPVFVHRYVFSMSGLEEKDTQYSYEYWTASIAGFDTQSGSSFRSIGMKKNTHTGTWVIQVDVNGATGSNAFIDVLFITKRTWASDNIPLDHPDGPWTPPSPTPPPSSAEA